MASWELINTLSDTHADYGSIERTAGVAIYFGHLSVGLGATCLVPFAIHERTQQSQQRKKKKCQIHLNQPRATFNHSAHRCLCVPPSRTNQKKERGSIQSQGVAHSLLPRPSTNQKSKRSAEKSRTSACLQCLGSVVYWKCIVVQGLEQSHGLCCSPVTTWPFP